MIDRQNLSFTELARFVDYGDETVRARYLQASILDWLVEAQALLPRVYSCSTRKGGDGCSCRQGNCDQGFSAFGGCPASADGAAAGGAESALTEAGATADLPRLAWEYQYANWPRVETQLLKAGLRLAALLDWVLGDGQKPSHFARLETVLAEDAEWSRPFEVCVGP